MAGSKRYFEYTTDTGAKYSVILDESNSEATLDGEPIFSSRSSAHPLLPKGIKMRYLLAESLGERKIQRKFYVGDPVFLIGILPTPTIEAKPYPDSILANWMVTAYRGEKAPFVRPIDDTAGDSGLNDGDQGRDEAVQ